ncbi:AMP-binding protein [Alicyclobacillus fastidiosus]|uniref:AMP-binding protein n=1 Tax=Alicyclobacillus fastidiosus TaxID=392011 RepID=A0ABV5AC13_9BACL|nr:AMP-binding protein [Alicyclobacillus fastidiosus]WEH10304.1 AMP-binding protein [Alicyclobacillus fastidiosus]
MASKLVDILDVQHHAIFLVNNTLYTHLERFIKTVPADVPLFVNKTIEQRYVRELRSRRYSVVDAGNLFTFRAMLECLKKRRVAFVVLDVDQRAFQTVGSIAERLDVPIVPVHAFGTKVFARQPIVAGGQRPVWDQIQSFLLESYLGGGERGNINLFNELLEAARYYGDDWLAVKDISGRVTYKTFLLNTYVLSRRMAKALSKPAENVGVLLPNSIGNAITLFALFYLGKTPVMLNYSAGLQTISDACETAGLNTILTSKEFIEKGQLEAVEQGLSAKFRVIYLEDLRASISIADKAIGFARFVRRKKASSRENRLILFTSGSEYRPRGIVLSHDNIFANVQQTRSVIDFGTMDKMLNAMPMFHSFGLTAGAILPLLSGVQTYLYPSPLHFKRIPELAGEEGSTILFGTSSFLEKYGEFAKPSNFRTLRYAVVGAERLKAEVETYWLEKFGLQIMQGYGATETAPIMCLDTPLRHKQDSVGRFLPGIQYKLETIAGIETGGKLLIQGPNVMAGFLTHGEGYRKQDGWYDTGDVVTVDDDGFVTIIGRLKRFAKIAGEMISLNLVEQLAARCYGITDFAAVNTHDPRRGEKVILFTTDRGISLKALAEFVDRQGYSRLHIPSGLCWVPEFPLLGSGKTDYVALKQQIEANPPSV